MPVIFELRSRGRWIDKISSQPSLFNELQTSQGYIVRLEYGKQKRQQQKPTNKMNMIIKYKSML